MSAHPALVADVLALTVEHEAFGADQLVDGEPTSGWVPLTGLDGIEIGVWEMTPGVITDVEADEVFYVVAGQARVEFVDPPAIPIDLRAGTLVRLHEGWRTRWTVTQTIRKIAVTPGEEPTR